MSASNKLTHFLRMSFSGIDYLLCGINQATPTAPNVAGSLGLTSSTDACKVTCPHCLGKVESYLLSNIEHLHHNWMTGSGIPDKTKMYLEYYQNQLVKFSKR